MMKNEYPILEYDGDKGAVIDPTHEKLAMKLPEKAVFAFVDDKNIEACVKAHNGRIVGAFLSITKRYPVYLLDWEGGAICLMQAPVGAAAATMIMDWLIGYGVKEIVATGSCGALEHFEENVFLVPKKALRDEGTSYHYLPSSRFVHVPEKGRKAIEKVLTDKGFVYTEVTTWTTDGFYRETQEKVRERKQEGCAVVEMECAALAACAQMRRVTFAQLLFTADTLADPENYNERDWGFGAMATALELSLAAVAAI